MIPIARLARKVGYRARRRSDHSPILPWNRSGRSAIFSTMDDETRTAIADLAETVRTGFARMDRYFELQQAHHVAFRAEMRGELSEVRAELAELRSRLDALSERVDRIETEVRSFRDWATREFADLRREIRTLERSTPTYHTEMRRDLDQLRGRVDRLEQRLDDAQL